MKNKDEVFNKFKEFKALIENHIENNIKTFWSDNGKEFKELCKDSSIKRELSTPYNPQHNGVAKRKNRTIMEATRAILHDQDLPMHLWAEAARIAVYVHNRTPHRVLTNKTPEEVFSSKKPQKLQEQCFMIRIFPCIYGQRLPEQRCMYRTVLHTEYSRITHLKKSFPARNQKSAISEYSVVQCTYTFQKRREQN